MLLDLCGPVAVDQSASSAPLRAGIAGLPTDSCGERGYPAYLLAEAFAQIACRSAQILVPLADRRYLPATTRGFELLAPLDGALADVRLTAECLRARPLPEFACRLVAADETILARATVVVAPAPIARETAEVVP